MDHYAVKGMSCAACVARVEKAVKTVEGVEAVSVSLLTNSMTVEGTASPDLIKKAVKDAGYSAKLAKDSPLSKTADDGPSEFQVLRRRFFISLGFLLVLMYLSMGHMMFGWPLPGFLSSHFAMGVAQAVLALIIMVINGKFFVNGFRGVLHGAPNMDTLVALGSGVSFIYSLVLLILLLFKEDPDMPDFYFESAGMILVLITLGKMLEAYSKGKTTSAIDGLKKLAPDRASVIRNGEEIVVSVGEIEKGDTVVVRPGESFPCDGTVTSGSSSVNEASLTGESVPVDKAAGQKVSAGTVNLTGYLEFRADETGDETMLAKIIRLVSDASATKAPVQRLADRIAGIFVPVVIGIAVVTFAVWMIVNHDLPNALTHAISVLVVSCPCALGLATPVAIMVGNGVGARNGILFKTAAALETCGKARKIVFDKTGTLTDGVPKVTDLLPSEGVSQDEMLKFAYALEIRSEHPLAKAMTDYVENNTNIAADRDGLPRITGFEAVTGFGLKGTVGSEGEDVLLLGGKRAFIAEAAEIPEEFEKRARSLAEAGKTVFYFALGTKLLGAVAVFDTLKADAQEAVEALLDLKVTPVLLSGDNRVTAATVGREAGISEVLSEVLPEEKEAKVREMKEDGSVVVMVGDGINDAPALTTADVGMAIGAGTDIAIDAADVVLINSRVTDVVGAVRLSRAVYRNIRENLFWAFFYNVLMIPLAAGVFTGLTGWTMSPMIGAAAMSLSSFTVVMNALRLNFVKLKKKA